MNVTLLPLDSITLGERVRQDLGDVDKLARSIEEQGLLHPIVVTPEYKLVVGGRRLEAFRKLGRKKIPAVIGKGFSEVKRAIYAERDENTCREEFAPLDIYYLAEILEPLEREEAAKRQAEGGKKAGRGRPLGSEKFTEANRSERESLAIVAKACGVSRPTLEKIRTVVLAAHEDREKYWPLVVEMNKTKKANGVAKKLKTAKQAEALNSKPMPEPSGVFDVIVIDPPWQYGREDDPTHRSANPYPSMSIDDIKALPVAKHAEPNCILWLWTTNSHQREAYEILDAWGFEFKTTLTCGKHCIGNGDWLRGQTEHCLLAVRGRPVSRLTNQGTLLLANRREHSRKPEEFYKLVEDLCPGTRLEYFARERREGWAAFGNDVDRFEGAE